MENIDVDLEILVDLFAGESCKEESIDSLRKEAKKTLKKSEMYGFDRDSVYSLAIYYSRFSSEGVSSSSLSKAIVSTIEVWHGSKLTKNDLLGIIETYHEESSMEDTLSSINYSICSTINAIRNVDVLAEDVKKIIKAYSDLSCYDENQYDLADATCASISYITEKNISTDEFIRKLENIKETKKIERESKLTSSEEDLKQKYKGLVLFFNLIKERYSHAINKTPLNNAVQLCYEATKK